jgi:hypothetical protein
VAAHRRVEALAEGHVIFPALDVFLQELLEPVLPLSLFTSRMSGTLRICHS